MRAIHAVVGGIRLLSSLSTAIRTDAAEEKLFALLRKVRPEQDVRVCGGWVRDKLLGKDCSDIDISMPNETGKSLAEAVLVEYARTEGVSKKVTVIPARPEQSKHLETAVFSIYDKCIDAVHLRSEDYANETSRIPSNVRFGTPKEDALRRDFTVNALFYNLRSREVEDFTGRGIGDLLQRRLVTPLDPWKTLDDDPLRLLRGIRFSCQLEFELSEDFMRAASDPAIHSGIEAKVSRERIRTELLKIILSGRATRGFEIIDRLGVGAILFKDAYDKGAVRRVMSAESFLGEVPEQLLDPQTRASCILSAVFLNYPARRVYPTLLEDLKFSRKQAKAVDDAVVNGRSLAPVLQAGWAGNCARLRFWFYETGQENWISELFVARLLTGSGELSASSFLRLVQDNNLAEACRAKTLIPGSEIARLVGGGRGIKAAIKAMIRWQFENPNSGPDEAARWLAEYIADKREAATDAVADSPDPVP